MVKWSLFLLTVFCNTRNSISLLVISPPSSPPQPAVETAGKAGKVLVRRKSYLPQDYDTVQALQNYTPQDGPLSKKDSTSPS